MGTPEGTPDERAERLRGFLAGESGPGDDVEGDLIRSIVDPDWIEWASLEEVGLWDPRIKETIIRLEDEEGIVAAINGAEGKIQAVSAVIRLLQDNHPEIEDFDLPRYPPGHVNETQAKITPWRNRMYIARGLVDAVRSEWR